MTDNISNPRRFAIIDDAGIIEEGPWDDVYSKWNDEAYMDELAKDSKHDGDFRFVEIYGVRH